MTLRAASVLLLLSAVIAGGAVCSKTSPPGGTASSGSVKPAAPPASAAQEQQAQPAASNQAPIGAAGAHQSPAAPQPNQQKKPLAFQGTVEDVKAADGILTVKNDNVPGWGMPAMTMSYHVSNPSALESLKAGDRVTATVYEGHFGTLYEVAAAPKALSRKNGASSSARDALPPLSYVCPTPGEENEIDDKPGACEKSSAKLVPVRLVVAYECLKGPAYIQAAAGVCRYDKSELAPITASMFWACSAEADATRYLEPGACADGSERKQRFEKRPHGDHNPRHGGPYVAMSEDLMHHAEGTFVAPGEFRAYFYDEYTRPMRVAGYAARLVPTDTNSREVGQPIPMRAAPSLGPNVMEARIPGAHEPTGASPLQFKLHVAVDRAAKDWTSDWSFTHYSKEPGNGGPPVPATPTSTVTTSSRTTSAAATTAGLASSAPSSTTASSGSVSSGSGSTVAGGAELGPNGPVQPDPVPPTASGILSELKTHTDAVGQQLQEGNLGGMWLDALRAKDLVIALQQKHENEVPAASRPELSSAVKELTRSAWEIDEAGDLGQGEKITELQRVFADSAARIQKLYGTTHP